MPVLHGINCFFNHHIEGTHNTRDNWRQGTSWMGLSATPFPLSILEVVTWQESSKYTLKKLLQ